MDHFLSEEPVPRALDANGDVIAKRDGNREGGAPGTRTPSQAPGRALSRQAAESRPHCLVLPSLRAKKGVYASKWLGRKRTVFRDMRKVYAIHVSSSTNTCWCTAPRAFTDHQRCLGTMRAEASTRNRTAWPTGPEIFTAWPSTEHICQPLLWEGAVAAGRAPGEKQSDSRGSRAGGPPGGLSAAGLQGVFPAALPCPGKMQPQTWPGHGDGRQGPEGTTLPGRRHPRSRGPHGSNGLR